MGGEKGKDEAEAEDKDAMAEPPRLGGCSGSNQYLTPDDCFLRKRIASKSINKIQYEFVTVRKWWSHT